MAVGRGRSLAATAAASFSAAAAASSAAAAAPVSAWYGAESARGSCGGGGSELRADWFASPLGVPADRGECQGRAGGGVWGEGAESRRYGGGNG